MANSTSTEPSEQVLCGVIQREGIEGMAAAVRNFFDLDAVQLEPGETRCQIDFVATRNVIFYQEHYPLRTHLRGELLGGRFGLALPIEGPPIKFSGEEMNTCRLASAMSGEEMDVHARGGLKQIVVLVDQNRLLELADDAGLTREVRRSLAPGRSAMPLFAKRSVVDGFARRATRVLSGAASRGTRMDRSSIEEMVYGEILNLVDVQDLPWGCPPAAVLVRRATELIDAMDGPLPIARLCSILHVSPTTLEKSFKKITGMTPLTFFLRRRLNRARAALLAADPQGQRVTEIAMELGFSELGRFSVRYRGMFGESPSETLHRRRSPHIAISPPRQARTFDSHPTAQGPSNAILANF
jgi:AraC-like DNA-binding protein